MVISCLDSTSQTDSVYLYLTKATKFEYSDSRETPGIENALDDMIKITFSDGTVTAYTQPEG